jgi:hypothetical protein
LKVTHLSVRRLIAAPVGDQFVPFRGHIILFALFFWNAGLILRKKAPDVRIPRRRRVGSVWG